MAQLQAEPALNDTACQTRRLRDLVQEPDLDCATNKKGCDIQDQCHSPTASSKMRSRTTMRWLSNDLPVSD